MRIAVTLLILALPVPALAQSVWDTALLAGALAVRPSSTGVVGYHDHWTNTGEAGVVLSRYWTPHVKTEVDWSISGEGRRYVQRFVRVPGFSSPYPVTSEQFHRVHEIAAAMVWQFLDNQWVHPFVLGGVSVEVDRVREETYEQSFYTAPPSQGGTRVVIAETRDTDPVTVTHTLAVVGGGAKMYVTPRVFFRTDGRLGFGSGVKHMVVRAGLGVDF